MVQRSTLSASNISGLNGDYHHSFHLSCCAVPKCLNSQCEKNLISFQTKNKTTIATANGTALMTDTEWLRRCLPSVVIKACPRLTMGQEQEQYLLSNPAGSEKAGNFYLNKSTTHQLVSHSECQVSCDHPSHLVTSDIPAYEPTILVKQRSGRKRAQLGSEVRTS